MLNKNIIFDFDGVIAETEHGRFELLAEMLKEYNIDLAENYTVTDIAGTPTDIFLTKNFSKLSFEKINTIVKKRRKIFFDNLDKYCYVYPGACETIWDLYKEGFNLVLATTNDREVGEKLINALNIRNKFSHKFYRETIQNKITQKKDYSILIKTMMINAKDWIVIEDSFVGVSSAKENSIYCIAFNRYDDEMIKNMADVTVTNYNELRQLLNLPRLNTQQ